MATYRKADEVRVPKEPRGPHSLLKAYRALHAEGKIFSGRLELELGDRIGCMVRRHEAKSLLDFGSGKGYQYLRDRVHERWGGILPYCYDFGVVQLTERPARTFDGVICTDMLEHIRPRDVRETLIDIFSYADKFAYLNICCRPAGKTFPDGTNLHLTVQPPAFWHAEIAVAKTKIGRNIDVWADFEYFRDYDLRCERLGILRAEHADDVPEELGSDD